MTSTTHTVTVIKRCQVSPPPETVAQTSHPLTFFDLLWLNFTPFSRLLFYDVPNHYSTRSYFERNVIPNLKTSLSLALQSYFLLAGNLITPTTYNGISSSTKPRIRYLTGDSVSLTIAEYCSTTTDLDFIHLTGNHTRYIDELLPLAPKLPPVIREKSLQGEYEFDVSPVLAVQVTLFPNHGISIGFTSSHAIADGSTMFDFIRVWSLISKQLLVNINSETEMSMLLENSRLLNLPVHDRSLIEDPKGLAELFISQMRDAYSVSPPLPASVQAPTVALAKTVRATFVMGQTDIKRLKKRVSVKLTKLAHISSFTVACGYIWSCLAKTQRAIDKHEGDEEEHFIIAVNCRARLNPPVPETYFGNCLTICFVHANNSQLVGAEGYVRATELIGESIHTKLNEGGVLKGVEMWYEEFKEAKTKWKRERTSGIAGSPKFYFYDINFGWGKPRKYEFVSEKLSISGCKDAQGDLEFGLHLSEIEMEAFSTIFAQGLTITLP